MTTFGYGVIPHPISPKRIVVAPSATPRVYHVGAELRSVRAVKQRRAIDD
jgi:hypothetical protein